MADPIIPTPGLRELPDRLYSSEFLLVRRRVFELIDPYYDRDHLTRAADWMLALDPEAPEYLVLAALTHDLERSIPGGPWLQMDVDPWDDPDYNRAHCERSADLVPGLLAERGAGEPLREAVRGPISEHEFGGSPDGDMMQAADSLSFLETNGRLCGGWARAGRCSREKAMEKLDWMRDRVRLDRARPTLEAQHRRAAAEFERELTLPETEAA